MEAIQTMELLDLTVSDWEGTRRARLARVSRSATVGEVVSEAVRSMGLPLQSAYQALFRGRELPSGDTLDELGVTSDGEIELLPQVSAGSA